MGVSRPSGRAGTPRLSTSKKESVLMSSLTVDVETTTEKKARTTHKQLSAWVGEVAQLCQPDGVHWSDGSHEEYQVMLHFMLLTPTPIRLPHNNPPNTTPPPPT